jgi:MFS family permease
MSLARPRLLDVRPDERRDVALAVATLFVFMIAHGVLETARDALFLARLPPERLPWVYVAMASTGVALAWLSSRRRGSASGGRRLSSILLVSALVTAALALPAAAPGTVLPYVVYVWTGLVATFGTVELWQLLGDHFTADQAKRLYGLVGAGAIVGVVVGSALAALLSERLAPGWLLLVAACISIPAAVLARRLPAGLARAVVRPRPSPVQVLREEPHARKLLSLVLLGSLTLTVANFLFKSHIADVVAPDRLGVFFGWFYAVVNAAALVVQVALTSAVMRWLGTVRSLAILPSVLVAGGAIFLGTPIVPVLVGMKAFDGVVRHSILKTAMEILFLPLPREERHALKAVLEALGQRGGQALASAGILLAGWMHAGPRALALAVVVLAVLWLVALVDVRAEYLALFRRRMRVASRERAAGREPAPVVAPASLDAARVLVERLHVEKDGTKRFELLSTLVASRLARAELQLDQARFGAMALATMRRVIELAAARVALESEPGPDLHEELVERLRLKERYALGRVFMLLSLLHPSELDGIEEGAQSGDPKVRAASHEIIAEVVASPLREKLLVWLDDVDDAEKLSRLKKRRRSRDEVLERLARDRSESVRALAAKCRRAEAATADLAEAST